MVTSGDEPQPSQSTTTSTVSPATIRREREQFWNLPNTLTVLRMAAVPVFLVFPWVDHSRTGSQVVAWLFIVAAVTDVIDGWLARRGHGVTSIGKLLDPLADKMLVSTALILLLAVGRIPLEAAAMVVIIIGRELAVTGLRSIASSEGHVVAAGGLGKLKAVCQNVAIGALFFPDPTLGLPAHALGLAMLTLATGLTLWSGYVYFADYFGWHRGVRGAGS
ncbi:MAG: CDP-diacylglycerol--glycerol-3-phosphate 3-phosphatidyltransferase [Myxococcales bacterium]|nr:CDP-diacylglycerol--glycerol-3-phosphate 3-phosphatidyltransferase [Myxococcales bacterium]